MNIFVLGFIATILGVLSGSANQVIPYVFDRAGFFRLVIVPSLHLSIPKMDPDNARLSNELKILLHLSQTQPFPRITKSLPNDSGTMCSTDEKC